MSVRARFAVARVVAAVPVLVTAVVLSWMTRREAMVDALDPSQRKDKEDLVEVLRERGYRYVTTAEEMAAAPAGKLWGAFAEAGIGREIDREALRAPSLDEMARKALEVLSRNRKGFFLMVEGSQVDWAAHANDGLAAAAEVFAFDRAVQAVLDFARKDGDTAVIIASDHSTGGLTIGNQETSDMPMDRFAKAVEAAKASSTRVSEMLTTGEPRSCGRWQAVRRTIRRKRESRSS